MAGANFDDGDEITGINIAPMVDIMLVLLVIFMVTAPLMTVGVPVDLPKTQAKAISESTEPLVISISKDEKLYLQEIPEAGIPGIIKGRKFLSKVRGWESRQSLFTLMNF